ncbi:MAG: lysine--tRNA ligase [Acidobacteria bacterium]|nr:lysine--tRNA ligase [Acidobacteriota bacterium]
MAEERERHWADAAADRALAAGAPEIVIATGISPSGAFHIGHLREILTGDAILRALRERGAAARLVFIVDNVDPLRKVYPFLDAEVYGPKVGVSLFELPAPGGKPGTYDAYFLDPFLRALERLRVDAEVLRASDHYASGRMDAVVLAALERRERLGEILKEVTGREVGSEWSPWNPRCPKCRRIDQGRVLSFDAGAGTVRSVCGACGTQAEQPVRGTGKLTWRVDWAARWKALGVRVEPFGKDHASRGGSYDSGERIAREVFGAEPPLPVVYEWVSLKGQGDMSSSRGNVLSVDELLQIVPPEVLRYLVMKSRPGRGIAFDPGPALLRLVDEVDDASAQARDDRALELSRAAGFRPVGVPFHHLVLVGQIAGFDVDRALGILAQGGYAGLDRAAVAERLEMARRWLERFAPDEVKVSVPEQLPESVRSLSAEQKQLLGALAERLPALSDAEQIHNAIRELAVAPGGPGAAKGFEAVYQALLGRQRGPRAGSFIAILGPTAVARRFAEAARS